MQRIPRAAASNIILQAPAYKHAVFEVIPK